HFFLNIDQFHCVPAARQATGDDRFTDFIFEELDVGDGRPTRTGDKNAVGVASFGIEPLGDLVRGVHRQVGELGVLTYAVTGNLQNFEAALFEMALEPLIDLVFIGGAN